MRGSDLRPELESMRRWEWRVKRGKELRGGEEYLYII